MTYRLHNFHANSAGRRVRTALHLKNIPFEYVSVDISPGAQEQLGAAYGAINPMRLIPALEHDGVILTESLAIIEYLEELHPDPALYPSDPMKKAQVRAFAMTVAAAIHPLNNTRVIKFLGQEYQFDQAAVAKWYINWADKGLFALETLVERAGAKGPYCFGEEPTVADLFLVPQYMNYQKLGLDLTAYPRLKAIVETCNAHPAFIKAAPENQPDFPADA
ncbi:MAG: maleylacetoacetate isomerase [Rhodobiaceae bacterium]|nr:maleylacetoacetate isomerase [Rhodobiaceae bacterium]